MESTEHLKSINKKISREELDILSKNTRGLIKSDIIEHVENYSKNREMPAMLFHPTNTCDPITGNWCEHLMDPYHLAMILANTGYISRVLPGYWGSTRSFAKRILFQCLNQSISIFGLRTSPYYIVYGKRI